MGRRRKNELKPGDNVTIYIPQDVEREVLHFMRTQANLSKTVFKILEGYVMRKSREYVDFDEFYSDKSETKTNTKDIVLNDEFKSVIRTLIKDELKNILQNNKTQNNETLTVSDDEDEVKIESKHDEKIKRVQNIIETDDSKVKSSISVKDIDDLFTEFSNSIENENSNAQKKVDIPKSYLWEYEDD